jgi:enamine deaminase RidA (YjgF/YER057c/UK114 family)
VKYRKKFLKKRILLMPDYEKKLKDLKITLPQTPKPLAKYVSAKKVGELVFCSGQGPIFNGNLVHVGKIGREKSLKEGFEAAKISALNCIAAIKDLIGNLNDIEEIVQLRGYVNCEADFTEHPAVINGASEILEQIFGEKGKHARCALGMHSLPKNISVEIEMIARLKTKSNYNLSQK